GVVLNLFPYAQASSVVFHAQVTDTGATATFNSVEGDVYTNVFVLVSMQRELDPPQPGGPVFVPMAFVSIEQGSISTGRVAIEAFGSTDDFNFTIDAKDLSTATLNAVIPMGELVTHTDFTANVNMVWSATGPAVKDHLHSVQSGHGLT